jgi:O-antigen/teichoic acid export membrane protein
MNTQPSLSQLAAGGVKWSIIQNWGGKVFTFLLSIVLARILAPTDFGVASAVALILLLVPMLAELGFGDAIMQRRDLKSTDANLPLLISIAMVVVMFGAVVGMADQISIWLQIPDQSIYVIVASGVVLFTAPSMFQEAMYKRNMKFKSLALRTFLANIIGGTAAIICAWMGFGIWSFVVQSYVATVISVVWLWWRPDWAPTLTLDFRAFVEMTRFGLPVVFQRVVDFAGSRTVDLIIIGKIGFAAYGIYALSYRLYSTLMQLLQGALNDVSLTIISTISSDTKRLSDLYLRTISLSATVFAPVFALVASTSPEICSVLLGAAWEEAGIVAQPLLLLGTLQCVQFLNGPFLYARGKPELLFVAGLVKSAATITILVFFAGDKTRDIAILFAATQLVSAPITFYFLKRELDITIFSIFSAVWAQIISIFFAFILTVYLRSYVRQLELSHFMDGLILGSIFVLTYLSLMILLNRKAIFSAIGKISTISGRSPTSQTATLTEDN